MRHAVRVMCSHASPPSPSFPSCINRHLDAPFLAFRFCISLRSSLFQTSSSTISISLPSAFRPHYEIPETPRAPHSSILQSFDKDLINKVSAATSQSGFQSRRRINSVKMTLPALVFASKKRRRSERNTFHADRCFTCRTLRMPLLSSY